MADNKSKISFIKIDNVIRVLRTRIKLLSSFVTYFSVYVIREVFLFYIQHRSEQVVSYHYNSVGASLSITERDHALHDLIFIK